MTELIQHEPTQDVIAQSVAAKVTNITKKQINATLTLLNEGSTVPFIARYRKEMTGELDEVQIRDIQSIAKRSKELVERKNTVLKAIFEQRKLTDALQKSIQDVQTLQELEDIYLPYKQKRRTRAMVARENGLQPLADWLMTHINSNIDDDFRNYVNEALPTMVDVRAGVHEILAEQIGENANYRQWLRLRMAVDGLLVSSLKRGMAGKDEQKVSSNITILLKQLNHFSTINFVF
ncbi:MAG: hypothetical protein ACFWTU_08095 [Leuconostoc mesenteroides]|jgi:uncharacterized protein